MKSYVEKYSLGKIADDNDVSQQISAIKMLFQYNRKKIASRASKYLSWDMQEKKFLEVIYN